MFSHLLMRAEICYFACYFDVFERLQKAKQLSFSLKIFLLQTDTKP
jgi:hypothetical protein